MCQWLVRCLHAERVKWLMTAHIQEKIQSKKVSLILWENLGVYADEEYWTHHVNGSSWCSTREGLGGVECRYVRADSLSSRSYRVLYIHTIGPTSIVPLTNSYWGRCDRMLLLLIFRSAKAFNIRLRWMNTRLLLVVIGTGWLIWTIVKYCFLGKIRTIR